VTKLIVAFRTFANAPKNSVPISYVRLHTHTHTHTECVMLIPFRLPQWLHECTSLLRYTYIACLIFCLHPFSHMIPSFDVFRQNYACVYFPFYATSPSHFYLIAQTVLGECIRPTRVIIIDILTRLGSGGSRTRWRLSMGKRLYLFLSIQPHIQWVLGIRRRGRKADLLPRYPAEVMNEWSCTFTFTYAFMGFTSNLMFLTLCMLLGRNLGMWR
jgi:hypothetical protein